MNYQRAQSPSRQDTKSTVMIDETRVKKVLNGDMAEMNSYAEELAVHYVRANEKERLTTSQIRNFLDEIQKMKDYDSNKLQLLRPKLAYAAGRHKGRVKDFRDLMEVAIKNTRKENFEYFKYFIEAIVAYHRLHGGK
ncbi:MAG: type III-A CRISPR-associated protein Csm2 [Candidatus Aminicenantes bacterium]|nr:type III-A CRISPR-associated protein Csm2 [Candidatus Aminicenantes bacterium]